MRTARLVLAVVSVGFLASADWLATVPAAASLQAEPPFVPGDLIVAFRQGVTEAEIVGLLNQHRLAEREDLHRGPKRGGGSEVRLVSVPAERTRELAAILSRDARVQHAELNYLLHAAVTPNDPQFPQLWGLNNTGQKVNNVNGTPGADIHAPTAWNLSTGSATVIVGIIDTGVEYDHPDLAANIWTNPGEIPGNGIDDDGDGYVDDVHGINAITNGGDPRDDNGHGTHVAGTIGARGNNSLGVVGVNWDVRLVACKFLDSAGSGTTAEAIKCFKHFNLLKNVLGQNILVTNNSWGGGAFSQALKDAMAGLDQPGMAPILHAVAAGNDNRNIDASPSFPASYDLDNLVVVAATDQKDRYAAFSNFGATAVDLAAPGVNILSTVPTGTCQLCDPSGFRLLNGTSMATPHVTGSAALLWAKEPGLTSSQVKARLLSNGDLLKDRSKTTATNSRLNVSRALSAVPPAPTAPTITSTPITQAAVGQPYAHQAQASGTQPITWSLVTAPAGMAIDSGTGRVTWTPGAAGSFPVQIRAANTVGAATQSYTLVVTVQVNSVTLNVTDGWESKAGRTLAVQNKVSVVQVSDNNRLSIPARAFVSFQLNQTVPAGASIVSVKVFVEHYEDTSMGAGALTWQVGGGALTSPTVLQSFKPSLLLGQGNEATASWDVSTAITTPALANDLKLVILNDDPNGRNTFIDRVFIVVQYN